MVAQPLSVQMRAFVGRSREFAALSSGLQAACEGRGTVCCVSGEPGIGKSRLLGEFAVECTRAGAVAHWGMAWEAGGAPAYWPWIQILRSVLAQEHGRAALNHAAHLAPALAQLVPECVSADQHRTATLEPEQARFALMDSVASLLQATAARVPLVLLLEDLHASDPDSMALLEFVVRQLRNARAMVVATYRDAEINRPRIGNIITRIRREAIQLHLQHLDRDAVREYFRLVTGERPLEQTVTELSRITEGHPLYLSELIELGLSRGSFRMLPASLSSAIRERASELPQETQDALGVASVLGREFTFEDVAELQGVSAATVEQRLAPAFAARLIERTTPTQIRFEHVLVREALHNALPLALRRELHERRAKWLEENSDNAGRRWSELAQHLEESGPEARLRAVDAWRNAAKQADARQAFDDAALCYSRALEALSESSPQRAAVLLELAAAQIRAGDLEAGRRNSVEAFTIGQRLGDAELMADAALTYGGIFTFGNVDRKLVQLLRTAMDALGESDARRKARVLARLAAAMQPAADPREPIRLAREAITMARGTNDPRTLIVTLRSAISALMDLGDPAERLALNREYVALAESLADLSESMRGYTRMVIDAMELADATTMEHAIAQCEALASRLVLPQYQWTATAFRVLHATIRGEFPQAQEAMEQAERILVRLQDPNAARTLLIQRLVLAELQGRIDEIRRLAEQLERAVGGLPLADVYLKPYLLQLSARYPNMALAAPPVTLEYVEQVIQFRDSAAMCALAEHLAALRDRALVERLYRELLPLHDRCGHWGLLGMRWDGPVARPLALLAMALGDAQAADRHFAEALQVATRMGSRPWVARICCEWAELLLGSGTTQGGPGRAATRGDVPSLLAQAETLLEDLQMEDLAARLPALKARLSVRARSTESAAGSPTERRGGLPTVGYFRLCRDGEVWVCECEGQSFRLKDSRGLQMLARLIAHPHEEFHVLDLMGAAGADAVVDAGDAGELLDERAKRDYAARIGQLRAELEEAEARHDIGRADAVRTELESLSAELARAYGLGGRARRAGSAVERARVNVQRRLKDAMLRIGKECPAAGRHLEWAVHTGTFCSYKPH